MNTIKEVRRQETGVRSRENRRAAGAVGLLVGLLWLASCGGGSSTTGGGGGTATPVLNTTMVNVDGGPSHLTPAPNMGYVSVTVCNPGSTTSCATIDHVQVDTGTSGLRILASAPGVSALALKQVTDSNSDPVEECFQFGDGSYLWGPVVQGDVSFPPAGEKAGSLPLQIINAPGTGITVPNGCNSGGGLNRGTVEVLQANGILGIGRTPQDCGIACATAPVQPYYWLCPNTGCTTAALPVTTQVSNPVIFFNSDNNGVMISMNAVGAAGAGLTTGSLTFGIGTQTDNALGSAQVYALGIWLSGDYAGAITIQSTYNGVGYPGLLDTGSPFLLFLDPATAGIPACSGSYSSLYCPASTTNVTISNQGSGGTAVNTQISIGNAQQLLGSGLVAFSNVAGISGTGASNDVVEMGMPFFYGRTVFIGIQGQKAPSGVNALAGYYAY